MKRTSAVHSSTTKKPSRPRRRAHLDQLEERLTLLLLLLQHNIDKVLRAKRSR